MCPVVACLPAAVLHAFVYLLSFLVAANVASTGRLDRSKHAYAHGVVIPVSMRRYGKGRVIVKAHRQQALTAPPHHLPFHLAPLQPHILPSGACPGRGAAAF